MNIRTEKAGYPSKQDILDQGFEISDSNTYSDMGQSSYTLDDYCKDDKLFLTGGYWNWVIKDKQGKVLFDGWWNTVEEFKQTLSKIG